MTSQTVRMSTVTSQNLDLFLVTFLAVTMQKAALNFELPLKEKEQKTRKASEDSCGGKDKAEKKWKADPKDKIVSPVIPQPGAWKRPPQYGHRGGNGATAEGRFNRFRHNKKGQQSQPLPNFKKKDAYFQYGNYLR